MKDEIDLLNKNNTHSLVQLSKGKSETECRWVFQIKQRNSINKNLI